MLNKQCNGDGYCCQRLYWHLAVTKGATSAFLAFSFKGYRSVDTTQQREEVVVKVQGALVPELGWGQQWELLALQLCSCLCPRGAAWQLQQQLKNFIRKLRFLKPHSASVLSFAAECLPRMFSDSTCLIRCKRSAHLPRAGDLLTLAEKATPVGLGPFGSLPWSSCGGVPAAWRGKQNFHVVFLF